MTYILLTNITINKKPFAKTGDVVKLTNSDHGDVLIVEFNGEAFSVHRDNLKEQE